MTPNILFILIIVVGALVLYPLTPHFFKQTKKFWNTLGVILIHIGFYGLLWLYLTTAFFATILFFELGVLALWDPLKIEPVKRKKMIHGVGFIFLGASVAIGLTYSTSFPIWLWIVPILLVLIPYLVPPLHQYTKPLLALALTLVLIYVGIMGFQVFRHFFPPTPSEMAQVTEGETKDVEKEKSSEAKEGKAPVPSTGEVKEKASEEKKPEVEFKKVPLKFEEKVPTEAPGPVTTAFKELDEKMKKMEEENKTLKEEIESFKKKNEELKASLKKKETKVESHQKQIKNLKKKIEEANELAEQL